MQYIDKTSDHEFVYGMYLRRRNIYTQEAEKRFIDHWSALPGNEIDICLTGGTVVRFGQHWGHSVIVRGADGTDVDKRAVWAECMGQRLEVYIYKKYFDQTEFAESAGVSQSAVSAYINGTRIMSVDRAVSICKALDISIDDLVGSWYFE